MSKVFFNATQLQGKIGTVLDAVQDFGIVEIMNRNRPNMILMIESDHKEMQHKINEYKKMLKQFLPEYHEDLKGNEHYLNGNFQWNEPDDSLLLELIELLGVLDKDLS